jgi:hypothetical protein
VLKLQNIEITSTPAHRLVDPLRPEFGVKITLQVGDQTYNRLPLELSADDARDVIALAVQRAGKMLSIDFKVSPDEPEPLSMADPVFMEPPVVPAPALADVEMI